MRAFFVPLDLAARVGGGIAMPVAELEGRRQLRGLPVCAHRRFRAFHMEVSSGLFLC